MKVIVKENNLRLIRFDINEDLLEKLKEYVLKQKILSASFSALGATSKVTLSYYNLKTKKYQDKVFNKDLEIVSMTGNISVMNDEIIIHAHGVFSDDKYQTVGGHLKSLVVSGTCEVHLQIYKGEIERGLDKETGLNLLK